MTQVDSIDLFDSVDDAVDVQFNNASNILSSSTGYIDSNTVTGELHDFADFGDFNGGESVVNSNSEANTLLEPINSEISRTNDYSIAIESSTENNHSVAKAMDFDVLFSHIATQDSSKVDNSLNLIQNNNETEQKVDFEANFDDYDDFQDHSVALTPVMPSVVSSVESMSITQPTVKESVSFDPFDDLNTPPASVRVIDSDTQTGLGDEMKTDFDPFHRDLILSNEVNVVNFDPFADVNSSLVVNESLSLSNDVFTGSNESLEVTVTSNPSLSTAGIEVSSMLMTQSVISTSQPSDAVEFDPFVDLLPSSDVTLVSANADLSLDISSNISSNQLIGDDFDLFTGPSSSQPVMPVANIVDLFDSFEEANTVPSSTSSVIPSSVPTSTPILTSTSISPSVITNMTSFPLSTLSTSVLSSDEVFDDEFDDFVGSSSATLNTSVVSNTQSIINNEKIELHESLAEQLFRHHHYKESFQCLYKQHYVSGIY